MTAEIAARPGRTMIFVRTQLGADRVAEQLREAGVMAGALHGGLTQGARTRILAEFKEGQLPVLVATDVAARGIHVDDIGLVLQVDPPAATRSTCTAPAGPPGPGAPAGRHPGAAAPAPRGQPADVQAGVRGAELSAPSGDARLAEVTGAGSGIGPRSAKPTTSA